ncbi:MULTISPECIES: STAS domain-containing protein [Amycolatopsis]|uniref:STAS domain-containing protein n=1 Tax=Amycolatopsis bullii TaxID=941987 RepID=A0ABQ3JZ69_9PSEU|nr:STAS domain-containing protein [Amycolatopsis bullii]GHF94460.1 hypothetical protein GCM10017567_06170 [Amycolatopsis bullii]
MHGVDADAAAAQFEAGRPGEAAQRPARVIWQPPQTRTREKLPPLPWRTFLAPVGVTLAGGLVFYVLIVELSYVLDGIGVTGTATVGLVSAIGSLATAVAAYLFPRLATDIVIDLADVTYLSSCGIALLLDAAALTRRRGTSLTVLARAGSAPLRILELAGLAATGNSAPAVQVSASE